jgi:hypothetical protein
VDEIVYVGEFLGLEPNPYTADPQADLDAVAANLAGCCGQYITGQYTLTVPIGGAAGVGFLTYSDQADVLIGGDCDIPEPGTIALAAMGFAALLFARRKY